MTKFSPKTCEKIIKAIKAGNTQKTAAAIAGVDESTFYRWADKGKKAKSGKYFKQKNLDIVIAGARKIDGNVSNPDGHITNKKGYHRYFPLYNWTHEEVLAYIYYYNLELPPIYQHEDGFTRGTGNWTKRPPKGLIHGWMMTEKADPNLIKLGLKHNLPGIHEYIQLKQGKGE